MSVWEILLTGIALSMDAFAVSVCKGLSLKEAEWKKALAAGLWFGGFQALMPVLGYLAGNGFYSRIEKIDHWVVFFILVLIGGSMIRDVIKEVSARRKEERGIKTKASESKGSDRDAGKSNDDFSPLVMLSLAVATSIDALAVGISFSLLHVNIIAAAALIGCTTFAFGVAGIRIGGRLGTHFNEKAQVAGGAVLMLIGTHILLQHLGVMPF